MSTPHDILKRHWGYDNFRPLQLDIINSVVAGRDTLGLLPTGGGKSLTFQVPALMLPGLTLVVTPLISLMKDQVDNLADHGIRATYLHAGLTRAEQRPAMDRCRLNRVKLLYVSPEKLRSERFIAELRELEVSLIVVDEAHCISQWGYDFRPSYLLIGEVRAAFPSAPVLALTASATPEVVADIMERLHFPQPCVFARSFARPNISYLVRNDFDKSRRLNNILTATTGSAIVYVRSRKRTREIASMLSASGITAEFYHAGLDVAEKNRRQQDWKDGTTRVIVATNAFGMGIDKPDVRVVVHYDVPGSLEEYYQEAGRAGRDGKESFAVLLISKADKGRLTRMVSDAFPDRDFIRLVYERACNFVNVAVGSGFDHVFEFNIAKFINTFDMPPVATRSALTLLTQAGYFEFIDEVTTQSRIMLTVKKEELYGVRLDPEPDRVLNTILRSYTGLFADFVYINETMIAIRAQVTEQMVYETLLMLSRMHVIDYVPRKSTPYLYFTTSRELPKHLQLSRAVYESQRERLVKRVDAMKQFAFSSGECRVNVMLRYFGEQPTEPCGKCDYCRERHQSERLASRDAAGSGWTLVDSITYMVGQQPRSLNYLVETSGRPRDEVIATIRQLIDEGKLRIDEGRDLIEPRKK